MTILANDPTELSSNPLDLIEEIILEHEWSFDRQGEDELTVGIGGKWCDYQLCFAWRPEVSALQFSCAFDLKVPEPRRRDLHTLIVMLNERLWIGHFDLWQDEGVIIYRHTLLLRGIEPNNEQIEDLVEIGISESERFYPAFQFAIWGGKSPKEAIEAAMLETVGEA